MGGDAASEMAQEARVERIGDRHAEHAAPCELNADERRARARLGRQAGAVIGGRDERAQELSETKHGPRILSCAGSRTRSDATLRAMGLGAQRLFTFVGGGVGTWTITRHTTVRGDDLPAASRLEVVTGAAPPGAADAWVLRGVVSNERYVTRAEKTTLGRIQEAIGRPHAARAALIPIKKSAAWWVLAQDERRAIFEERSAHIAIGLKYLPAVARRLHHCRDLGEPFDFLTWFDYRAEDEGRFDELLARLRETEEWRYVEREIDVRVEREDGSA